MTGLRGRLAAIGRLIVGARGSPVAKRAAMPTPLEEARRHGDELYDEENYVGAMRCYREAADQGDPIAQFYVAWLYFYGLGVDQDDDEARAWLTRAAEKGESDTLASMRRELDRRAREPRDLRPARGSGPSSLRSP